MPIISAELLQVIEEAKRRFSGTVDPRGSGLREWLVRGGTSFVVDSSRDRLLVEATDPSWADANGADIARFLSAASESILPRTCTAYDQRSLAWACVSNYYSALYLSLALMRTFGHG